MSVSINILKYYGRYYPTEAQDARPMWWFCRTDETVISREELETRYGYKNLDNAEQTGLFIPLFQVDMPALEKSFLKAFHFRKRSAASLSGGDFDADFKAFIETAGLFERWHEFEGDALKEDAITWCRKNGIKYVDQPVTHPVEI